MMIVRKSLRKCIRIPERLLPDKTGVPDMLANHKCWEPWVSAREAVGQNYCTERGEAKENEAENGVDEAEKDRKSVV